MRFLPATLLAAAALLAACGQSDEPLPGTELGDDPAPAIELKDSNGELVTLAQYRGRPVVVTFLYTDCPDVCPVIGQRVGQAVQSLGKDGEQVAVIAVSVDPEGDTPEKARAFMAKHSLTGPDHHYLLGNMETLPPVWFAYGVGAVPIGKGQQGQQGQPPPIGRVGHTDGTFLIDRDGRKRTLLRAEATADEIAGGLRILLR